VILDKYKNLSIKSPKEAADIVGEVEKRNYLAHTIRDIELAILRTQSRHYHIITCTAANSRKSKILFFDHCCEIWLTCSYEEIDERDIRLILAHELGHLVFNIDKLENPEILQNTAGSDEEEIKAWIFAYHLIYKKSVEHQNDTQKKKFIYRPGELRQSIESHLKRQKPEISDAVIKSLFPSAP
jgi:hypothetical protein